MEDKKSIKALRRAVDQAEQLFEINRKLSMKLGTEELLAYITETACEVLRCETNAILLFDEETQKLQFAAATGVDAKQITDFYLPLGESLAGIVFSENRSLIVNNLREDPRYYRPVWEKVGLQARSMMGVPLRIENRPAGVLVAFNKQQSAFEAADVKVLSVIAAQAAIAIRNTHQMEELQRAYDRLRRIDQLKTDFLALASHELRTPLSAIMGYGAILQKETDEALNEHIQAIFKAVARMEDVIEKMTCEELMQTQPPPAHPRRADRLQQILEALSRAG